MRNVFVKFDSTLFESKSVCHGMIMILFPFLAAKEKAFLTFIAKYNALHYYVYYLSSNSAGLNFWHSKIC